MLWTCFQFITLSVHAWFRFRYVYVEQQNFQQLLQVSSVIKASVLFHYRLSFSVSAGIIKEKARVVAMDLRGHGKSVTDNDFDLSVEVQSNK